MSSITEMQKIEKSILMVPYQVFFLSWVFVINLVILHSHVGEKKIVSEFC